MVQRYGALAKRLQHSFCRGVTKGRIDAAERERQIASREQTRSVFRELLEYPARGVAPVPTSGRGCPSVATSSIRFPNRRELVDTLCFTGLSASRPRFELIGYFSRNSPRFLIPSGGLVQSGSATFCSEARASTASQAVHGQGASRGSIVARNLTRWTQRAGQEKSQSMLMYLIAMVVAVVGFTYASVPLYRRFCQATGYGGTVKRRETVEEKIARREGEEDVAAARELVVHFNADVADSMPWKFTPCQNQIKVKVGQSSLAFYTAENTSSEDISGVSTYNVAPMQAGAYFNKIQCFCFEEQRLRAGEKIDMPVLFYIDPEFATDPKMSNINSLILSYTFFKIEDEEEE